MANEVRFLRKGKYLEKEEAAERPVTAAVGWLAEENLVLVFDSQQEFMRWAEDTRYAGAFSRIGKTVMEARNYEHSDNEAVRQRQSAVIERISNELNELADRASLEQGYKEVVEAATINRNPLEPPIFESVVLFDGTDLQGAALPLPNAPFPNLGWFGWGDRASSILVTGAVGALHARSWFRGARFYFGGAGLPSQYNLTDSGWSNRAYSVTATGIGPV
jgi:hypothetical protein